MALTPAADVPVEVRALKVAPCLPAQWRTASVPKTDDDDSLPPAYPPVAGRREPAIET
ncbi:MAG: hypothetical protein HC900_06525 [Methylacidiphilales bacterium]|nr:hypothetical protein [Candidatus Methylacidiphilales bacterium]